MANPEHVALVKQGAEAIDKWRRKNPSAQFDLNDANLAQPDFGGARLRGANLNDSGLSWANLNAADLEGANLERADLSMTWLCGADLSGASLGAANMAWANLSRANLRGADLSGARMWGTVLAFLDLRQVKGLENVQHLGPSSIGIETIYMSNGEIPEVFLRGAGVPEPFIAYAKSLVGRPFEFYSCFISYSTKDQDFANRLYADLQAHGVRCWFAPHDVKGGRKLHEQIDEAIRIYEKLLLILSPHSMSSEWVKTEIAKARQRETRERVRMLFPISLAPFADIRDWECFDADTGKDSAREIREYFLPDFSQWKDHDRYQQAFERLLADLKSDARISA